jgi:outer membrane protein assembly factor BamB
MNRRRALAALAGAATAGLGIVGWEVAPHVLPRSGPRRPTTSQPTLPKVPPGKLAWRFNAKATPFADAQAGDVVYAVTNGNAVFAVNATTGRQIWKRATTTDLNYQLMVTGNSVVISGDNGPYALAAANGNQLWHIRSQVGFPLLVTGGVAYVAFAARNDLTSGVTALDPGSGTILWTFAFGLDDGIAGMPTVADGVVYVTASGGGTTASGGEIFALSAANGAERQRIAGFGDFGAGTIAVVNGVVYACLDDKKGTVVAVDTASGATLWRQGLGRVSSAPSVATTSGIVFAGTMNAEAGHLSGKLYALDTATGRQLWSVPVNGGVGQGPVAAGGVVYTGGGNLDAGILEAWQPTTGKRLWSYPTPDYISDITVVPGSRVYFGSGDYLYSLGA